MQEILNSEIYEKIREKVFFYVTYQKRTESEVRRAVAKLFQKYNISDDVFEDLIEELKEKGHIDDKDFVRRRFNASVNSRLSSVKEIEYKILQKGIPKNIIDDYISENREKLDEHEIITAKKLYNKKITDKSDEEVRNYLRRKGFREDVIANLKPTIE